MQKIHAWSGGLLGGLLLIGILAWQNDSGPSSPEAGAALATESRTSSSTGRHPAGTRDTQPRNRELLCRAADSWPLPQVPPSEIESRRAEMLAEIDDASRIQDRAGQDEALARICYQWAGFDPRGAVENAIAWELEEVPGLFQNLALQWASADLNSVREWTELQPASEFRSELVARIGFAIAQDDPAAAAEYVLQQIDEGPVRTEAAISVLHQWILKDPSAARSWAEGFSAGDLRDRALGELAGVARYGQEATATQPAAARRTF